jgi:hypothetical protein
MGYFIFFYSPHFWISFAVTFFYVLRNKNMFFQDNYLNIIILCFFIIFFNYTSWINSFVSCIDYKLSEKTIALSWLFVLLAFDIMQMFVEKLFFLNKNLIEMLFRFSLYFCIGILSRMVFLN